MESSTYNRIQNCIKNLTASVHNVLWDLISTKEWYICHDTAIPPVNHNAEGCDHLLDRYVA